MGPFRFRAQPALELRRRQDDEARRACAAAEMQLMAAQAGAERARLALDSAQAAVPAPDAAFHEREWYRFWIVRLEQASVAAVRTIGLRRQELEALRLTRQETRKRVNALERFREKAREEYDRAVLAEEQRQMDAAGTARFVAQRRALASVADRQTTKERS